MGKALLLVMAWTAGVARGEAPASVLAQAVGRQDFAGAAKTLEQALDVTPDDAQLASELSEVYDHHGYNYEKAVTFYQSYLTRFPLASNARLFQERLAVLEKHRAEWALLKEFRDLLDTSYQRADQENIERVKQLLDRNPHSGLRPELLFWLASEHAGKDRAVALQYADQYLATFPANGKSPAEHAAALVLRSELLTADHRYHEALAALDAAEKADPAQKGGFLKAREDLLDTLRAQMAFRGAALLFIVIALGSVAWRPWRHAQLRWQGKGLVLLSLGFVLATMLPVLYLHVRHFRVPSTFLILMVLGIVSVVVLKLLTPLSWRFGRAVYLGLSLVLVCSALFMAFYLSGTPGREDVVRVPRPEVHWESGCLTPAGAAREEEQGSQKWGRLRLPWRRTALSVSPGVNILWWGSAVSWGPVVARRFRARL